MKKKGQSEEKASPKEKRRFGSQHKWPHKWHDEHPQFGVSLNFGNHPQGRFVCVFYFAQFVSFHFDCEGWVEFWEPPREDCMFFLCLLNLVLFILIVWGGVEFWEPPREDCMLFLCLLNLSLQFDCMGWVEFLEPHPGKNLAILLVALCLIPWFLQRRLGWRHQNGPLTWHGRVFWICFGFPLCLSFGYVWSYFGLDVSCLFHFVWSAFWFEFSWGGGGMVVRQCRAAGIGGMWAAKPRSVPSCLEMGWPFSHRVRVT